MLAVYLRTFESPFWTSEVLMLWRHITKHCLTTPLKAVTPIYDMQSMFPHPINAHLPSQINGMKHGVSVNIDGISWIIPNWRTTWSGVCISTRWKHTSGTVAVHTALPATHHAEGPQNRDHTAATPPTVAQKQVHNTLGNYVYISKFTKHISCS